MRYLYEIENMKYEIQDKDFFLGFPPRVPDSWLKLACLAGKITMYLAGEQ